LTELTAKADTLRGHASIHAWVTSFLLVSIMAFTAVLRLSYADWDGGNNLHPDERAVLFAAQTIEMPASLGDALRPSSPLNPFHAPDGSERPYPYGHLPLYMVIIVERLLSLPCQVANNLCRILPADTFLSRLLDVSNQPRLLRLTYTGRTLSALYGTLTVLVTFLLARKLFNRWAGITAAACCAVAVLHIQNAHFGTVDTALGLTTTLALWLLVRYTESRHRRDSLLAGLCAGLAIGCKATAVLLIIPILVAHLRLEGRKVYLLDMSAFWLTLLLGAVAFTLTNPYAALDPAPFLTELVTQADMVAGYLDWPFTRQYIGTPPLVYLIEQQARWELGLPLTLACYTGLGWAVYRAVRTHSRSVIMLLTWCCLMLLTAGLPMVKFPRYALPLTPVLFALASGMLSSLRNPVHRIPLHLIVALLVLTPTFLYALAFHSMYSHPHPWIEASLWVYRSLPHGTVLAVERWDDPLPLDLIIDGTLYLRDRTYITLLLDPFAEPDNEDKLLVLLSALSQADYLILSSNRLYGVIPRLPERYPLTSAYYRSLFAGDLGFELDRVFTRTPNLFGLRVCDDPFSRAGLNIPPEAMSHCDLMLGPADESFTVYDHPMTLIFKNTLHLRGDMMVEIVQQNARSLSPSAPQ
jgi:hypothetical protein